MTTDHRQTRQWHLALSTALDYAPLEDVLGSRAAAKYMVRELLPSDGAHLYDRMRRRIDTVRRRTWSLSVTVVHVDRPRVPLVSLVASKYASSKKTLTVHDAHVNFDNIPDEHCGLLVLLVLLVAQTYAYMAYADTIKIRDVGGERTQSFMRAAGYDISKRERGLLYGTRRVLSPNPLTTNTTH